MSSKEGYDAYCLYLAINNHFHSDSYDFFKYNGKVSAKLESFMKRKDKYHFAKLLRLYGEELKDFLIANLSKQKYYVRNLLEQECANNYKEFKKKKQKLTYTITEDMKYLSDKYKHIDVAFEIKNGQHSNVLREYLGGKINAETFIACDKVLNIFKDYDSMIQENFIWPREKSKLEKLTPFLELEHKKLLVILKGIWNEHTS
tara:strand:- start:20 stop:625 length:606 start_codon:yes stop_codon:yes gene_type:complete